MRKITIAIDGYSSTGKSTIAKQLADALDYLYVDTGAMYRAIALFALQNDMISKDHFDKTALIDALSSIELEFKKENKQNKADMYLNGKNIEEEIRKMEVSAFVSPIAAVPEVRSKLVAQQKQMKTSRNGIVMDGRDIGTVVFPQAELKMFLKATAAERAQRRYKELMGKGVEVAYDEVLKNIQTRDHLDTTREDSPLKKAVDAIEIDNSEMNLEDQFQMILQLAKDRIAGRV